MNKSVVARYEAGMTAMRSDKLVRLVAVLEGCGVRFVGSPSSQFIGLMVENPLATTKASEPPKGGSGGA